MGPRCSSAETQVCHRSYIIAASTWAERFDFYESKITKPEYNPRTESDIPPITSAPMDL